MRAFHPAPGDWAVITGAGSGIGRWLCEYFAGRGMAILALDIGADAAAKTAEICAAHGVEARGEQVDVSDRDAIIALAEKLGADGIVPSLLWANAGVGTANTTISAKPETVEWLYGVNVLGPIWTAQAFVPQMVERKRRSPDVAIHVGMTASSASVTPVSGPFTLYATTKQATAAVGEAWAAELADHEIGVTILCPGILDTDIWNSARSRPDRFGGARNAPDEIGGHWRKQPAPPVMEAALNRVLEAGGGWCIVPTEPDTVPAMAARHAAQTAAISDPQPEN